MNNYNLKNQGYNYVSKKIYFAVAFIPIRLKNLSNLKKELIIKNDKIFLVIDKK